MMAWRLLAQLLMFQPLRWIVAALCTAPSRIQGVPVMTISPLPPNATADALEVGDIKDVYFTYTNDLDVTFSVAIRIM